MEQMPNQEKSEESCANDVSHGGSTEPKNQDQSVQSFDLHGSGVKNDQSEQIDNRAGSAQQSEISRIEISQPTRKKTFLSSIGDRLSKVTKGSTHFSIDKRSPNTDLANDYFFKGVDSFKKGDWDQAISNYDQAIQLQPDLIKAYNNRGFAYYFKRDLDRAFGDFNRAIQINPKDAMSYSNRALIYSERGDLEHAISDFDRAIKLNPKDAMSYNNRGFAYYEKEELEHAISDFNK